MGMDRRFGVEGEVRRREERTDHPSVREAFGFFAAVVGLLFEPRHTTRVLFEQRPPLFVPQFLIALTVVIFAPIVGELVLWRFVETRATAIAGLALALFLTAVLFVYLETLFLRVFREYVRPSEILAAFAYASAPLVPIVLCYYALDLVRFGELTIVTFIITGVAPAPPAHVALFPVAHVLAKICFLIVFYFSLRQLVRVGPITTGWIVLLSSVPFYAAFAAALSLMQLALPGSVSGVVAFVLSFLP